MKPLKDSSSSDPGRGAVCGVGSVGVDGRGVGAVMVVPMALTALVYLVFALVTVFWQDPTVAVAALFGGVFLLALGALAWMGRSRVGRAGESSVAAGVLGALAGVYGGTGVLALLSGDGFGVVVWAGLGLGVGGAMKFLLGATGRVGPMAAGDWMMEGLVNLASAVLLMLLGHIGAKAVLGVLGGGALMCGVFLAVGAIGLREGVRRW